MELSNLIYYSSFTHSTQAPRVLHVGPLPPPWGGVATNLLYLLESGQLSMFDMAVLNTARPSYREDVNPDKRIWHLHRLWRGLKIYCDAWQALCEFKPDIVHIQSAGADLSAIRDLLLALIVRQKGRRVVFQQHFWADPIKFNGPQRIFSFFYRLLMPQCNAILMSTPLHIEQASQLIRVDRVYCFPNTCVPPENLGDYRIDAGEDICQIVYIGRLSLLKGIYDLITAIGLLKTSPIQFRFVLVGVGATVEDDQRIASFVRQNELGERVILTGRVSEEEKWNILSQSQAMVFPTHTEQFPVTLIEGLAAGLPIITTSVDYLPRLIVHDENGLIVPPGHPEYLAKALLKLALNPADRERMSKANQLKFRSEYSLNVTTDRLRRIYEDVLSNVT